ncbi:hypothetical protein GF352_00830 [archaeon]|nr:hypothetical protein [archaeon]
MNITLLYYERDSGECDACYNGEVLLGNKAIGGFKGFCINQYELGGLLGCRVASLDDLEIEAAEKGYGTSALKALTSYARKEYCNKFVITGLLSDELVSVFKRIGEKIGLVSEQLFTHEYFNKCLSWKL